MFNDFERRSKVYMNVDDLCNRFTIGLANDTLRTHAMSHMAKSVAPLTIVAPQIFLTVW
jgi:hypothetical protein